MKRKGYTLVELVVVIGVMAILIGAGMGGFYQSLKSGSKVDLEAFMDSSSRVIENSMAGLIGFAKIVRVADQEQSSCLAAGANGVWGESLVVEMNGVLTEYDLEGDFVTSGSALISPEGVKIDNLNFNWICSSGENEKVKVGYTARAEKDGEKTEIEKNYLFEVLIRNSGYY